MKLALASLLAGCNVVFPLSASPSDAATSFDAPPCEMTSDEDSDGIDDSCDLCPTVHDDGRNAGAVGCAVLPPGTGRRVPANLFPH